MGRRTRMAAQMVVLAGLLLGGCKTTDDASAAATQMSSTAKALTDYYAAQEKILDATDVGNRMGEALFSRPYADAAKENIRTMREAAEQRGKLAEELTTLAQNFAKLTGTTAPAEVANATREMGNISKGLTKLRMR